MQQFGASAFYTVVHWHELCEVNNECALHISIVFAICVPKIIKFGEIWQRSDKKQVWLFFGTPCTILLGSTHQVNVRRVPYFLAPMSIL